MPLEDEAMIMAADPSSITADQWRRINMTLRCPDCAGIPKVAGAGQVFSGPNGAFQMMHNGLRVLADAYYGPWMTELIRRLQGHHEPQEEKVFHALLSHVRPGGTMLELGSHWSYYSLWFHHAVPGARTVLVEPDPAYLEVGQANCRLNGVSAEFHQACVGSNSGEVQFRCESDGLERSMRQIGIDQFLSISGIATVDLLLADIQGAEWPMLQGAIRSLTSGAIRFLVLSTHHHSISGDPLTHRRCLQFIREHGGHVLAEHDVGESFSGDGLIAASFRPEDRDLPAISISRNRACEALFPPAEEYLAQALGQLDKLRPILTEANSALAESMRLLEEIRPLVQRYRGHLPAEVREALARRWPEVMLRSGWRQRLQEMLGVR